MVNCCHFVIVCDGLHLLPKKNFFYAEFELHLSVDIEKDIQNVIRNCIRNMAVASSPESMISVHM